MKSPQHATRRDSRLGLRPGSATVEFDAPGESGTRAGGEVTKISVAGFAFETDRVEDELPPETRLEHVTIRVGPCELRGAAVVRHTTPGSSARFEVGCLFFPENREAEDRLMALVAGVEAARPD